MNRGPGPVTLEADTVVAAFAVRPAADLAGDLSAYGDKVHVVGDAVNPAKAGDAINDAYVLAYSV